MKLTDATEVLDDLLSDDEVRYGAAIERIMEVSCARECSPAAAVEAIARALGYEARRRYRYRADRSIEVTIDTGSASTRSPCRTVRSWMMTTTSRIVARCWSCSRKSV